MSTELATIENTGKNQDAELAVTEFFGGVSNGPMLQLTQGFGGHLGGGLDEPGFIQLTKNDVIGLIPILNQWVEK